VTNFAYAPQTVILPKRRALDAIRYGGVLTVWLGLTALYPSLGMDIYQRRRADSPLRRRSDQRIPSQIAESQAR
jgi:hypothetical protein